MLIDEFGDGRQLHLDDLVAAPPLRDMRVYHVGSAGPIRRRLARVKHYVESRFEPDHELGSVLPDGFRNESLESLTFPDRSFDLIVSSHVLEHVPDPWLACREMFRVLRPGGRMIHSIPSRFPLPDASLARAEMIDGEVVHHAKPRYHKSPEGRPALVFTRFGADLPGRLRRIGFDVGMRRPHLQVHTARRNLVLVGRRPNLPNRGDHEEPES
ncbi:MAG: methyltransferase domain-containing protein [Acidimicrobiales bacterium]